MNQQTDEFGTGLAKWNLQSWFDYVMVKILIGRVGDVIPKTYVPILRIVAEDTDKVDEAYRQVCAEREPIGFLDSPRDRWRKIYGSYIRELEWVYGELHRYFPTKQYEEIVTDIMARTIRDWLGAFVPSLERATRRGDSVSGQPHAPGGEPGAVARAAARAMEKAFNRVGQWVMKHINPASFMVGPVEMKMLPDGELEMFVPRCWMHTAPGNGRTQDQACMRACKGACEQIFGPGTPMHMVFDPHLPDYSCTLHVKMGGAARRVEDPALAETGS